MTKRFISLIVCVALVLGITANIPLSASAANIHLTDTASSNSQYDVTYYDETIDGNSYNYYSSIQRSYFTVIDNGYMRVYGIDKGQVYVEYYDSDYCYTSGKIIDTGLELFGGFYENEDYYFVLTGGYNYSEDDNTEVFRLTKFDKDWTEIGHVSAYGCNTTVPFNSGSCRFAQFGNHLIIRSSHEMYKYMGQNHQANITLKFDISEMTLEDSYYNLGTVDAAGYVTHSFNQFIKIDSDGTVVCLDHGDAYPRAALLGRYIKNADEQFIYNNYQKTYESLNLLTYYGGLGDNFTGANIGGLEISNSSYLTVGTTVEQDENYKDNLVANAYLTVTDKDNMSEDGTKTIWLTSYDSDSALRASNPQIIKFTSDRFLVMWNERPIRNTISGGYHVFNDSYKLKYLFVDGEGNSLTELLSGPETEPLSLISSCEPINIGEKIIWFNSDGISQLAAVEIDYSGNLSIHKISLPENLFILPINLDDARLALRTFEPLSEDIKITKDNFNDYVVFYKNGIPLECGTDFLLNTNDNNCINTRYENGYLESIRLSIKEVAGHSYLPMVYGSQWYADMGLSTNMQAPKRVDDGIELNTYFRKGIGYHIYRKEPGGEYEKIGTVNDRWNTVFIDKTAQDDKDYWYIAREFSYDKNGNEVLSEPTPAVTTIAPDVTVEDTIDGVHLSWSDIEGAKSYIIERKYPYDKYYNIVDVVDTNSFDSKELYPGLDVSYRVTMFLADDSFDKEHYAYSGLWLSSGGEVTHFINTVPVVTKCEITEEGWLYVEWNKTTCGVLYEAYDQSTEDNHIIIKNLTNNYDYNIKVRAWDELHTKYVDSSYKYHYVAPGLEDWDFSVNYDNDTAKVKGYHGDWSNVVFPESFLGMKNTICSNFFRGTDIERILFKNKGITSLGGMFKDCTSLSYVELPDTMLSLNDTFEGCTSLKTIILPKSLKGIADNTFKGCTSLEEITIPSTVSSINDNAFTDCENLKEITIPRDTKISYNKHPLGFMYNEETDEYSKIDGFVIKGYGRTSSAAKYADHYGFKYIDLVNYLGDIDNDKSVTIMDATMLQRCLASVIKESDLLESVADIDKDGFVTIVDVTYIQRWLANIKIKYAINSEIK